MMDTFIGIFGAIDQYRNVQTVGEEYPDVPFNVPSGATQTVFISLIECSDQMIGWS